MHGLLKKRGTLANVSENSDPDYYPPTGAKHPLFTW
jgi:hypothetical protein